MALVVEHWNMEYQVIGLHRIENGPQRLAVLAETVEEEAAQKLHDYYEARGIQTIVVKQEVPY